MTRSQAFAVWWLRYGPLVLLALLVAVWVLPTRTVFRAVVSTLLLMALRNLRAAQAARVFVAQGGGVR